MTVHVVDNHKVIYEGFVAILKYYGIKVKGYSKNGLELINWLKTNTADVLIVDYSMPEMDGEAVLKHFARKNENHKVLIFSSYAHYDHIRTAMTNGARGYLLKSEITENIVEALNSVNQGFLYASKEVQDILLNHQSSMNVSDDFNIQEMLSPIQVEILSFLLDGFSYEEISDKMSIAKPTVRQHLFRIREKLEVKTNIGLVKLAIATNFKKQ